MPSSSWHASTTVTRSHRSSGKGKRSGKLSKEVRVQRRDEERLSEEDVISEEEEEYDSEDGAHDDGMPGTMHQSYNEFSTRKGNRDHVGNLPDFVSPGGHIYRDAPTSVSQRDTPSSAPNSATRRIKKGVGKMVGSLTKKIGKLPLDMTISSATTNDFSMLDDDDDTFAADESSFTKRTVSSVPSRNTPSLEGSSHKEGPETSDEERRANYLGQWMGAGSNHVVPNDEDDSVDFSVEDSDHTEDSISRIEYDHGKLKGAEEPENGAFPGQHGSLSSLQSITDEETVEQDEGGGVLFHQNSLEDYLSDNQEVPRRRSSGRKRAKKKSEVRPRARNHSDAKRERRTSRRHREHLLQASKGQNSSKQSLVDENLSDDDKDEESNTSLNDSNQNSMDLSSMSASSRRTSHGDEEQGSVGSHVSNKSAKNLPMSSSAISRRSRRERQEQRERIRRKMAPRSELSASALDITNVNSDGESSGSIQFEEGHPMGAMPMSLEIEHAPTHESTDIEPVEDETLGIQLALDGLKADPLANKEKKSKAGKALKKMKKFMGGMGLRQPSESTVSTSNEYPEALALQPMERFGTSIPDLSQNDSEEEDEDERSTEGIPTLEPISDRNVSDTMPTLISTEKDEYEEERGRYRARQQRQSFPGLTAGGLVVDNAAGAPPELRREVSTSDLEWKRDASSKSNTRNVRTRERSLVRDRNLARQSSRRSVARQNSRVSIGSNKMDDSMMGDASRNRRSRRNLKQGDRNSSRSVATEVATESCEASKDSSRDKDDDSAMVDTSKGRRRSSSRRHRRRDEKQTSSSAAKDPDGLSNSRDKEDDPADAARPRRSNGRRIKNEESRPSSRSVTTDPDSLSSSRDKDEDGLMLDTSKTRRQSGSRRSIKNHERRPSARSVAATEVDGGEITKNSGRNGDRRSRRPRGSDPPANRANRGTSPTGKDGQRTRRPKASDPPAERRQRPNNVRRRNTIQSRRTSTRVEDDDGVDETLSISKMQHSQSAVSQLKW